MLKRGASVNLPSSTGFTALIEAAIHGHTSIVLVLLQHSANPDLQDVYGDTALTLAAYQGHEACVQALLHAEANTQLLDTNGLTALEWAEAKGQITTAELLRQHAAPPQPAATAPAVAPDAGEPAESSPASLPVEILQSSGRGELQKVIKWLRKGGLVDALCPVPIDGGPSNTFGLLHVAATKGQLETVRELLKRGASIDLQSSLGHTALMNAAGYGRLSVMLVLLQHSANPDLQDEDNQTALMVAAVGGHEACVQALLRAKANTQLLDKNGRTSLLHAEIKGHTATAKLIRQHASCLSLRLGVALCARVPLAWPWVVLSVVLGAIASVAFIRNFTAPV